MYIKNLLFEDFINYKEPSMFIGTCFCDFKCCKDAGIPISVCQNFDLLDKVANIEVTNKELFNYFRSNYITKAIVIGGLEPFYYQGDDVIALIKYFREHNELCTFIIYTGYELKEIEKYVNELKPLKNIIIKTGRFIPNQKPHYDEILGVTLTSDNQKGNIIC